jgi:hypothetical protein
MTNELSDDYYDYTQTMQPETPWHVDWHQSFVDSIMHGIRGSDGATGADPELTAAGPKIQITALDPNNSTMNLELDIKDQQIQFSNPSDKVLKITALN